ncbi:MAG: response regulator [Terriglobales bacterium]
MKPQRQILCIDDDEQSLQVRKILLESFGYGVTTATRPSEGLRAFHSGKIDAVVLDYQMPEMNGCEAARAVKAVRPDVPVMILSALPWLPEDAPRECIDAFLTKGEPTAALVSKLEKLIASKPPTGKFVRLGLLRMSGAALGIAMERVFGKLRKARSVPRPKVAHVH